jgi:hypothetical protein
MVWLSINSLQFQAQDLVCSAERTQYADDYGAHTSGRVEMVGQSREAR